MENDIWIGIVLLIALIGICCWGWGSLRYKAGYDAGYAARGVDLLDSVPDYTVHQSDKTVN